MADGTETEATGEPGSAAAELAGSRETADGRDLPPLGAHVSVAGGLAKAVERGREIEATVLQVFTKQPQRWAEPDLTDEEVDAFRSAVEASPVRVVVSHDSYLINLASEKPDLLEKSEAAFRAELARCVRLGIDYLVTHPGNATGGDREAALARNARALGDALADHPGATRVLVETTAGSGTALGWRFDELAQLLAAVPDGPADRPGVCIDTAHLFAAGYDLRTEYEDVMAELDAEVGLERLALIHVNDSRAELGSRVDRHAHIGEGELGEAGFAALMRDPRLRDVPRVLETPKEDDATAWDRRNLAVLRRLAADA